MELPGWLGLQNHAESVEGHALSSVASPYSFQIFLFKQEDATRFAGLGLHDGQSSCF
jgi:hypothetical protein